METDLRSRVRAGDHDAFGDLFDAYARSVHHHAHRLTGGLGGRRGRGPAGAITERTIVDKPGQRK